MAYRETSRLWRTADDAESLSRLGSMSYLLFNDRQTEAELLAQAQALDAGHAATLWRAARAASRDRRSAELLDAARALLASAPDDWRTELTWQLIAGKSREIPALGPFLDELDEDALPANPQTREVLLRLRGERLAETGRRDEALAWVARRGYVTDWVLCGPAGAIPSEDFATLDPLAQDDGAHVTLPLRHVPITPGRPGGGTYDAWAEIEVEQSGPYLVTTSASASFRVAVDAEVLMTQDRWRAYPHRDRHAVAWLDAGAHTLQVRLATDLQRGSFSVRIVPLPSQVVPTALPATDLDAIPGGALDVLRSAAAERLWDPEIGVDRALAEALAGVAFHGRPAATELAAAFPGCADCQRRAGQSVMADAAIDDETRRLVGLALLRRAVELDPDLVSVTIALAERLRNQDTTRSREMLSEVVAQRPDLLEAKLQLADTFASLSWDAEAEAALLDAEERAPAHPEVLRELGIWFDSQGKSQVARGYQLRELRELGSPFSHRRADILEELGRLDEAAAELQELQQLDPYDEYTAKELVRLARAVGADAAELAQDAAERFQDAAWPLRDRAYLALAEGDADAALDHLDLALRADPGDLELRKARWRLAGDRAAWLSGDPAPPGFDPADPDGAVRQAIASFEEDPGDAALYPAVVLLDRRELQVFEGGASVYRLHRAIRLQERVAVDAFAEITPGNAEMISVRTWRPDGTAVDADAPAEKDAYSLRDLTAGCTVELQGLVGLAPAGSGEDGAHVGPEMLLVSEAGEYLLRTEIVYLLPPGAQYEIRGTAPPPERTELPDGGIRLRWLVERTPPPNPEPHAPTAQEYLPWLQVVAWTDVDESAVPLRVHHQLAIRPDPQLEALAQTLRIPDDPEATARAIVDHVRREVRLPAPGERGAEEAVDILALGSGPYEPAVVALLHAAGVPADWVRVRPRHLADLGDQPRVAADYTDELVRVPLDGSRPDLWLDLSGPYIPMGWLHPVFRNAEVLAVVRGGEPLPDRTPAPSGELPGLDAVASLWIDADGNATGTIRLEVFQQSDGLLREDLWSVPPADQLQIFEAWLAEAQPGISVQAVRQVEVEDPEGPAVLEIDVAVPGMFHADGEALETPLFFPDLLPPVDGQSPDLKSLVLGGPRRSPLLIWPYHESLEIRLSGPGVRKRSLSGWPTASLRWPLVQITRGQEDRGREHVLHRHTTFRFGRIDPQDYPSLRDELAKIVSAGRNPLRLEK